MIDILISPSRDRINLVEDSEIIILLGSRSVPIPALAMQFAVGEGVQGVHVFPVGKDADGVAGRFFSADEGGGSA